MDFKRVLVIGAGQMGSGIAQVMAQAGLAVVLRDIKEEFVRKGIAGIEKNLAKSVENTPLRYTFHYIFGFSKQKYTIVDA